MTDTDVKPTGTRRKSLMAMMAALLAGSIVATSGGLAHARGDGHTFDPTRFQQRIEERVDRALSRSDATAEQKKKISEILQAAFRDMKPLHDKRVANRKAMEAAMQEPTIDPAKIEAIRVEQMKVADEASRRFTKALIDAGNVLSAAQRQAFFKSWNERHGHWRG